MALSTFVRTRDFIIQGELCDIGWVLHGRVWKWTPRIAEELNSKLNWVQRILDKPCHAVFFPDDPSHDGKFLKFLRLLGFLPWRWTRNIDERNCLIYRRYPLESIRKNGRIIQRIVEQDKQ